ncbi:MAG: MFS transporter, partial [Candidatus Competibacterales bacterium]|nr:MFS transporter [Candidatus Competibacterales bacterium]
GLIMSGYFLGLLLGGLHAVRIIARAGHIRAFAAFASLMSIAALLHAMLVDPWAWGLMRLLAGFSMAGLIMITESWINERASNVNRGQVLAVYMTVNYAAAGCGQFLLPLADPGEFVLFSVASIVFSLALLPLLLTQAPSPQPVRRQRIPLSALYRISPLGLIGAFSAGLAGPAFHGLGAVFAQKLGLTLAQTSAFMASGILGGLLLQWPLGRLSDRIDRRWVMSAAALGTALASLAIVLVDGRMPALFAAAILFGSFCFTLYSLSASHTNDFAPEGQLVQVAGGLLIAFGIGASIGPLLAGAMMDGLGPRGLFIHIGLVTTGLGLFSLYRMTQRGVRSKRRFVVKPSLQHSSDELYQAALAEQPPQSASRRAPSTE